MKSRYTANALQHDIADINKKLAFSGSCYRYKYLPREGYSAVDLHAVEASGKSKCVSNVQCGSPRECFDRMEQEHDQYLGKSRRQEDKTMLSAFEILHRYIKFSVNFDSLKNEEQEAIRKWNSACNMPGDERDFFDLLRNHSSALSDERSLTY